MFHTQIPPNLKEPAQYGSGLQALALSLTNTVNAAMNKTSMFLSGITDGALAPCDGYVAKLQARAARCLLQFREELRRIAKYRKNYFLWLEDFALPTTNNLSERGLRGIKSHVKISGQFESVAAADNHALIRTYIETCRRNGINEIYALQRLCEGKPCTVAGIFHPRRLHEPHTNAIRKADYASALFVMPRNLL